MKNFRTLEQARGDLKAIQEYIELIENYQPHDFRQHVIHTYAHLGNVQRTAKVLNDKGFEIEGRPLEGKDISNIITSNPPKEDLLHRRIKSLYLKKTRANRRSGYDY